MEHGQITRYQIIAPTSWNFAARRPRRARPAGTALQGVADHELSVQHVVRSFDPHGVHGALEPLHDLALPDPGRHPRRPFA